MIEMVIFCIPCLVLILYFAVAGIFVPKYRLYFKEAWACFMDKLGGRRCSVSFDNRMRIALSTWLTKIGMVRLGRFFHNKRNFSLMLTAFLIVSTIVSFYLFALLVQFWFNPPCTEATCSV
jgi:hypothetical protein